MRDRFLRLTAGLSHGIHERDQAISLGLLALLAGESLFLLGPPGTAKSLVARRLKAALAGARAFEYLMGRFSTPEEIFGPLSIAGLRDRDVFERRTSGYLPEADVAFLDEVWRASPPIQNTLLTILNEKRFRNGDHEVNVPLKLLVAASNRAPAGEENAEAFWDRFVIRLEVGPLTTEAGFRGLVTDTADLYRPRVPAADVLRTDEWEALQLGIDLVEVPDEVVGALASLRRALGEAPNPIVVSDRRWKKAARLLRACAVAHGRAYVDGQDLGLLEHVLWERPDQRSRIAGLLVQTLEEEGWPGPESLESHEAAVEDLRSGLRTLTLQERTVTRPRPVLQDGEYFTLVGYPGDLSARVWAQDHSLLKTDEDLEGELFFFTPYGPFRHSEKHLLRATGGPAEVEVDGRLFALESRPEETTVFDRIPADGPRLKAWDKGAHALTATLIAARKRVDTEAEVRRVAGAEHLFCAAYSEACGRGLERDSADLGDLLVRLETLVETRDPD
jgi:MoxR-like ATPase